MLRFVLVPLKMSEIRFCSIQYTFFFADFKEKRQSVEKLEELKKKQDEAGKLHQVLLAFTENMEHSLGIKK